MNIWIGQHAEFSYKDKTPKQAMDEVLKKYDLVSSNNIPFWGFPKGIRRLNDSKYATRYKSSIIYSPSAQKAEMDFGKPMSIKADYDLDEIVLAFNKVKQDIPDAKIYISTTS